MQDTITLCGDNCSFCPRSLAHTQSELEEAAALWFRVGWRERVVPTEEIACGGCSSHKDCTYGLVACIQAHEVEKCRQCGDFPCEKIEAMLRRTEESRLVCLEKCTPEEFTLLDKAFFRKKENLLK